MENTDHKVDSLFTYVVIFVLLMLLLIATVIAGNMDLGRWNTVVALLIAVLKALLVILFFMHVRHSSHLTMIFVVAGFLWLGLLLALTATDYATRERLSPNSDAQIAARDAGTGWKLAQVQNVP
jgi:cytochrome c oxidase subunit 4